MALQCPPPTPQQCELLVVICCHYLITLAALRCAVLEMSQERAEKVWGEETDISSAQSSLNWISRR